ncbi:hypothetical protein [Barnesiella sp.]|jgi:hypothetical protein|uniref:hypothetical protein n=1 Tax=Barnesiella sp. TaxID=2033407 RepID=UPI00258E9A31|nr:hypothetical protein [Barnesiella sp.]
MNPFEKFQIFIVFMVIVGIILTVIIVLVDNKKLNKKFTIVDKYSIMKDTSIYYRSYRNVTLYTTIDTPIHTRTISSHKPANLYISADSQFLEVVSPNFLDKELTILNKNVLVLRLENIEGNKRLITYSIDQLPEQSIKILNQVEIGDIMSIKQLTIDLEDSKTPQTAILINSHTQL